MNIKSVGVMSQKNGFSGQNKQMAFGQFSSSITKEDVVSQTLWRKIKKLQKEYGLDDTIHIDLSKFADNVCAVVMPTQTARYQKITHNLKPDKAESFFTCLNSDGDELLIKIKEYAGSLIKNIENCA